MKIAALVLAAFAVSAQAADKFDPQDLRKSFVSDCVMRGLQRGGDAETATKFCTCSFDTLATNLTVAEYLEVDRTGKSGGKPETLPAMQRVMPKMAQCRPASSH